MSILPLLLAIAKAVPSLESLFRSVVKEIDAGREREAQQRKTAKDNAVDAAFDHRP